MILLTNELRVMTFLNRVLNRVAANEWVLLNGRRPFLEHFESWLPHMLAEHYRALGAGPGTRWGDKNPHYADPRNDPECLELIDRLMPAAQFLNIVRDARDVVASLVKKGWASFDDAVEVWRGHVTHAADFGDRVGQNRMLTVRYEDLVADAAPQIVRMLEFLGLGDETGVYGFAAAQAKQPTPFSKPTTEVSGRRPASAGSGLTEDQHAVITDRVGSLLDLYGYPT